MKKITISILIAAAFFAFSGCGYFILEEAPNDASSEPKVLAVETEPAGAE